KCKVWVSYLTESASASFYSEETRTLHNELEVLNLDPSQNKNYKVLEIPPRALDEPETAPRKRQRIDENDSGEYKQEETTMDIPLTFSQQQSLLSASFADLSLTGTEPILYSGITNDKAIEPNRKTGCSSL